MTMVLFKEEKRPFVTEDELVQGILKYGSESSKKDILTKIEKSEQ